MLEFIGKIKYHEGNKRSYGKIEFKVKTSIGIVSISGEVSPGCDVEELELKINKHEIDTDYIPNLEVPHYQAGRRSVEHFKNNIKEFLSEDIEDWIKVNKNKFKNITKEIENGC